MACRWWRSSYWRQLFSQGPEPNSKVTVLAEGASVSADALSTGDGGRAIVWSDEYTSFLAVFLPKASSGSGGFVETSSKDNL